MFQGNVGHYLYTHFSILNGQFINLRETVKSDIRCYISGPFLHNSEVKLNILMSVIIHIHPPYLMDIIHM